MSDKKKSFETLSEDRQWFTFSLLIRD